MYILASERFSGFCWEEGRGVDGYETPLLLLVHIGEDGGWRGGERV